MSNQQPPQSVQVDPKGSGPSTTPGAPATPPHHEGPGRVKRTARSVKHGLLVVVGTLIAAFAIANSQDVKVQWIFGETVQAPLILVIGISLVAGLVIGWIIAKLPARGSD